MYHAFADLAGFGGGELVECRSSGPSSAEGSAVRRAGTVHVVVANLTPRNRRGTVAGLPPGPARTERVAGGVTVELPPYTTARIDAPEPSHLEGKRP